MAGIGCGFKLLGVMKGRDEQQQQQQQHYYMKKQGFQLQVSAGGGGAGRSGGCGDDVDVVVTHNNKGFPEFLPKEVDKIKDPFARSLAQRMQRLPVQIAKVPFDSCIMSSCVRPLTKTNTTPLLLLHCFDSSCLEWRCTYPLLEDAGLESWAVDILGWGFSDLGVLPPCDVASKRHHLYQLWKSYVKRPMVLVGPSLGASVAIDFTANYPEAVEKLVLINPSVYAEGTGELAKLPVAVAYAGVDFLRSLPLRLYANLLAFNFNNLPFSTILDWTNVGRLHCKLPWWKDATVNFMFSGGYNVVSQIKQVEQRTLIIYGDKDQIVDYKLIVKLHSELPNAIMRRVEDSGHLPHVDMPKSVTKLIVDFVEDNDEHKQPQETQQSTQFLLRSGAF